MSKRGGSAQRTQIGRKQHYINTSYIERNNLTVRNGVSRVIRKTIDFSKRLNPLIMHVCLFFAWFNLVKPHDALKIEIADGGRRWKQRTPVASC